MTKKILIIFSIFFLNSCFQSQSKDLEKNNKASAASSRINSTKQNSQDLLKEIE
jgi:hypothetical protein